MSHPMIPLQTLLDALRALELLHQHVGPIPVEKRLLAASAAGELRYWTTLLLADAEAPVALRLVPSGNAA